ncbi:MAG: hypothetical protein VKJ06_08650 [Vampirovibrionales bacterium]|nr:hypothetical protein [Vampirovibrionales bacterium]
MSRYPPLNKAYGLIFNKHASDKENSPMSTALNPLQRFVLKHPLYTAVDNIQAGEQLEPNQVFKTESGGFIFKTAAQSSLTELRLGPPGTNEYTLTDQKKGELKFVFNAQDYAGNKIGNVYLFDKNQNDKVDTILTVDPDNGQPITLHQLKKNGNVNVIEAPQPEDSPRDYNHDHP